MANNVDPDQMPHSAVLARDLHCLQRLSVPILRVIMIFILPEFNLSKSLLFTLWNCRPRWLSWMRRPTGDRKSRVQPPPRSAIFFRGDIFYGHSLPSAHSRRAVVSFWRKNVHNTG